MKNGKIAGIGKAGNPDNMDGVTEGMIAGSNTEVRTSPSNNEVEAHPPRH